MARSVDPAALRQNRMYRRPPDLGAPEPQRRGRSSPSRPHSHMRPVPIGQTIRRRGISGEASYTVRPIHHDAGRCRPLRIDGFHAPQPNLGRASRASNAFVRTSIKDAAALFALSLLQHAHPSTSRYPLPGCSRGSVADVLLPATSAPQARRHVADGQIPYAKPARARPQPPATRNADPGETGLGCYCAAGTKRWSGESVTAGGSFRSKVMKALR